MVLITTAIKETFPENIDEKVLFLGEWCKDYHSKSIWGNRNYVVVDTYLKDREKFNRNHEYLEGFYERMLQSLSNALNEYHNTNYPLRYWRIVLGHWLSAYISAVWNRWESLRIAFDNHKFGKTYLISTATTNRVPISHSDAFNLIDFDHLWNHRLYAKILTNFYSSKIDFVEVSIGEIKNLKKRYNNNRVYTTKYIIASWFDKFLGKIIRNQKIIFVNSYFNFASLVRISLKLKQIPRLYTEFDENLDMPEASSRSELVLHLDHKNEFELFVLNNIISDIPISYIEGYGNILERATYLFPDCKIIFTANAHLYNELFKVWCAERVNSGKKLIISDHGVTATKYNNFSHEDKISDLHVVWHRALNARQVQMPPNILANRSTKRGSENNLAIIKVEFPLYVRRCASGTISSLTLDDYRQKIKFTRALDSNIREHIKIRIKSNYVKWNVKQRYINELGVERISVQPTLMDEYNNSKIIVCTYPQTSFLEAMFSGVPTILLYKKEYWELHHEFDGLFKLLEGVNIVFSNPISASNHINKVWKNPDIWWNSTEVKKAREKFFYEYGYIDSNWLNKWSVFLKNQLTN